MMSDDRRPMSDDRRPMSDDRRPVHGPEVNLRPGECPVVKCLPLDHDGENSGLHKTCPFLVVMVP